MVRPACCACLGLLLRGLVGWLGLFGSGFFCLVCYFCLCPLLFLFQLFVALVSVFIDEFNERSHGF